MRCPDSESRPTGWKAVGEGADWDTRGRVWSPEWFGAGLGGDFFLAKTNLEICGQGRYVAALLNFVILNECEKI